MNQDVARLLAADRQVDLRRGYYAGAPTGARTGT